MKNFIIGLFAILIIITATAFILIPKQLTVSAVIKMSANENAVFRYLSDESKWAKWWPKEKDEKSPGIKKKFTYDEFTYQLTKVLYHAVDVDIINKNGVFKGKINIIPLHSDSVVIQWQNILSTKNNPLKKIFQYFEARNIKNNMTVILDSLKSFSEDKDRVYAFNIRHTTLKDTFLVATKTVTTNYPSIPDLYVPIKHLQTYIANQGAKEVNFPMLSITKTDSLHYNILAAIPTDRRLNGKGIISFKRMIAYKDKVLTTEVKGGPEMIEKAYKELNDYMKDYNLTTPVIHWELLITDRSKETNTTKWITKIYIPIV